MILLFHILVALGSLVAAGSACISPSNAKLKLTYVLSGSMLVSGSYLVTQNSAHLIEACVMGLVFLMVVSLEVAVARNKLARQTSSVN